MNTKIILSASAIFMGIPAFFATFLPQEILVYTGFPSDRNHVLIVQTIGALYFGFAVLNSMSRHSLVGGIYSRPLVVANWAHFFTFGMALLKTCISVSVGWEMRLVTTIYLVFAAIFGRLFFAGPKSKIE